MDDQKERAVFFIDGSNWYHAAKKSKINTSAIDYRKFARKLSRQYREVIQIRSADGDFIPAVETVRETGKKVFAATPASGYELKKAVNRFIYLKPEWFSDDIFLT